MTPATLTPLQIRYIILGLCAFVVFALTLGHPNTRVLLSSSWNSLSFDNPFKAYHILKKLDINEATTSAEYQSSTYGAYYWGLLPDNEYCEKHRSYFVENPNVVFQNNFFTDYAKNHQFRTSVIPQIGRDLHTKLGASMQKNHMNIYYYRFNVATNMFFTYTEAFTKRVLGKQFSCLTQTSNHIPGHDNLAKKELVYNALEEYSLQYKSRSGCFDLNKFVPKTWFLKDKDQCLAFFKELNNTDHRDKNSVSYFKKVDDPKIKDGKVFPVNLKEEENLKKTYKNGENCGKIKTENVLQVAVAQPLLIDNRKFDIRAFMLVASTNPLMAYYHDGYLTMSLYKYNTESKDGGIHLAHTDMAKKVFEFAEQSKKYSMEEMTKIKRNSYAEYSQLQEYLRKQGMIVDAYWLDNYLRPQMQKAMIHLLRMSQDKFSKKSSIYELYAVDFVMDENLNLWFIDANSMPSLQGWTPDRVQFFNRMMSETFEIVSGLLKSRAKRIVGYINDLCAHESFGAEMNGIQIYGLERRREEFKKLSSNYFEAEFEPSLSNGFVKIVDENYIGQEKYSSAFEPRCF